MKKAITLVCFAFVLSSCNKEYNEAMKSADKNFILKEADKYYDKKKWKQAIALYERLPNLVAGTDLAAEVVYKSAYANYYDKNYKLAGHQFKNFAVSYPQDARREEALYMSALCFYEGSLDYNLDQDNTKSAINELQDFLNQYPNSERSKNIGQLLDELNYKLEFKAFENAKQYYKIGEYKACDITFQNMLNDFPATKLRQKIYGYMMKSKEQLAIHSSYELKDERLDNAIAFTREVEKDYPGTDDARDAAQIRKDLENEKAKFAVTKKDVEAKKAEYDAKLKKINDREASRKEAKNIQESKQTRIDSAKTVTPQPAATFRIPRGNQ